MSIEYFTTETLEAEVQFWVGVIIWAVLNIVPALVHFLTK